MGGGPTYKDFKEVLHLVDSVTKLKVICKIDSITMQYRILTFCKIDSKTI